MASWMRHLFPFSVGCNCFSQQCTTLFFLSFWLLLKYSIHSARWTLTTWWLLACAIFSPPSVRDHRAGSTMHGNTFLAFDDFWGKQLAREADDLMTVWMRHFFTSLHAWWPAGSSVQDKPTDFSLSWRCFTLLTLFFVCVWKIVHFWRWWLDDPLNALLFHFFPLTIIGGVNNAC